MKPKEVNFAFPRGDTCPVKFNLLDEKSQPIILKNGDELYFTVKQGYKKTDPIIIQKKFSTGDITQVNEMCSLVIETEETNDLEYGTYVFDICLVSGDYVHTFAIGKMALTNEVTHLSKGQEGE